VRAIPAAARCGAAVDGTGCPVLVHAMCWSRTGVCAGRVTSNDGRDWIGFYPQADSAGGPFPEAGPPNYEHQRSPFSQS